MAEQQTEMDMKDEGATISPYLLRPCRSYAQALRDLKRRTAEKPDIRSERAGAASRQAPQYS